MPRRAGGRAGADASVWRSREERAGRGHAHHASARARARRRGAGQARGARARVGGRPFESFGACAARAVGAPPSLRRPPIARARGRSAGGAALRSRARPSPRTPPPPIPLGCLARAPAPRWRARARTLFLGAPPRPRPPRPPLAAAAARASSPRCARPSRLARPPGRPDAAAAAAAAARVCVRAHRCLPAPVCPSVCPSQAAAENAERRKIVVLLRRPLAALRDPARARVCKGARRRGARRSPWDCAFSAAWRIRACCLAAWLWLPTCLLAAERATKQCGCTHPQVVPVSRAAAERGRRGALRERAGRQPERASGRASERTAARRGARRGPSEGPGASGGRWEGGAAAAHVTRHAEAEERRRIGSDEITAAAARGHVRRAPERPARTAGQALAHLRAQRAKRRRAASVRLSAAPAASAALLTPPAPRTAPPTRSDPRPGTGRMDSVHHADVYGCVRACVRACVRPRRTPCGREGERTELPAVARWQAAQGAHTQRNAERASERIA